MYLTAYGEPTRMGTFPASTEMAAVVTFAECSSSNYGENIFGNSKHVTILI